MSVFKDLIRHDANNLFLNLEEFGDIHTVDGRRMTIMIDDSEQDERNKAVLTDTSLEAIYDSTRLIYVRSEEYGRLPSPGKLLNLDGNPYRITKATDEYGIYSITIERVKS